MVFKKHPPDSFLRRLDSRCKLAAILAVSILSLKANIAALLFLIGIQLLILLRLQLSIGFLIKEIRYFLLLLVILFVFRSITDEGNPIIDFKWGAVTDQGIAEGALVCMRLLQILLTGLIFIYTTSFTEIKAAVEWFLKPVPFIPEKKVSVMIGLLVRFIPLIVTIMRETSDAQKSRCIDNRKNPVYRIEKLSVSSLRKIFEKADTLAGAMEARCFSEIRTDPEFSFGQTEYRFIVLLLVVWGIVMVC